MSHLATAPLPVKITAVLILTVWPIHFYLHYVVRLVFPDVTNDWVCGCGCVMLMCHASLYANGHLCADLFFFAHC